MNPDGINRLVHAVVCQAAVDYLSALRCLAKYETPPEGAAQQHRYNVSVKDKNECEWFFTSSAISYYTDLDGAMIMAAIRRGSKDDTYRITRALRD